MIAMTLGDPTVARVRLIVWCLDCRHQAEPDPPRDGGTLRRVVSGLASEV
jgi:hypothetical protein